MKDDIEQRLANVGERIKEARIQAGLARQKVAELTGITETAIGFWERTMTRPTLVHVKELASHFNVTPDWLLGRDLVEEALLEEAKHSYVCINRRGLALDELDLETLESMRELLLYVLRHKRAKVPSATGRHPSTPQTAPRMHRLDGLSSLEDGYDE